jgi:hypothetical protein
VTRRFAGAASLHFHAGAKKEAKQVNSCTCDSHRLGTARIWVMG